MLYEKKNGKSGPLGRQLTDWIEENLTLTQGHRAGHPFRLFGWQRKFCRGAFRRGVKRAGLSLARGPGKTTLIAGIATAAIAPGGPLGPAPGRSGHCSKLI